MQCIDLVIDHRDSRARAQGRILGMRQYRLECRYGFVVSARVAKLPGLEVVNPITLRRSESGRLRIELPEQRLECGIVAGLDVVGAVQQLVCRFGVDAAAHAQQGDCRKQAPGDCCRAPYRSDGHEGYYPLTCAWQVPSSQVFLPEPSWQASSPPAWVCAGLAKT